MCARGEGSGIFQWNMPGLTKVGQLPSITGKLTMPERASGMAVRVRRANRRRGAPRYGPRHSLVSPAVGAPRYSPVSPAAWSPPDSATISSRVCGFLTTVKRTPPSPSGAKP
ncbi:MAG: hypothetical protein QOC85_34 [Streptomyces sp.]|nr:hypothetical protein [Streptomyces sp.]